MAALFLLLSLALSRCFAQTSQTFDWEPCSNLTKVQCSNFSVPLDYANPSIGSITLRIAKLPATASSGASNTMWVSPGGPGISAVQYLSLGGGDLLAYQLGPTWDILTWDPRGVGGSGPNLKWFDSYSEEEAFWNATRAPGTLESHGNLTNQDDIDFFMSQAPIMDSTLKAFDQRVIQQNGANLTYLGSAAGVRDLAALADAVSGSGSAINFYGYSYGTIFAMYLTQLFPERVGKVILDGVCDPSDWSEYQPFLGWDLDIADSETVWDGFTTTCASSPTQCVFARNGDSSATVNARFEAILEKVKRNWNSTDYMSLQELDAMVYSAMYNPGFWTEIADFLENVHHQLFVANQTGIPSSNNSPKRTGLLSGIRRVKPLRLPDGSWFGMESPLRSNAHTANSLAKDEANTPSSDYSIIAIECGDAANNIGATTEDVFRETIRVAQTVSRKWGSMWNTRSYCHAWSSRAVERYQGPWNKPTANPVLVIGNQADPITPFRNAKLIASSSYLGSSARLVQRWDFGHTSESEYSPCIDNLLAAYANNGTLPPDKQDDNPDIYCSTAMVIFGSPNGTHFNPPSTENGDALTSGPNDPGLTLLNDTSSHNSGSAVPRGMAPMIIHAALALFLPFTYI